ncbi:HAD hydrolase-like protein [Rhodococcus cerastii]|nr:HAD hydrolase-like protein [Rhodococcus cerastii]
MTPYLVWDWNGTLFDDRALLWDAVRRTVAHEHGTRRSAEELSGCFARPLRALFENVLGPLTDPHWARVEASFHRFYRAGSATGTLVPRAREALTYARENYAGQSLLSNWPHHELLDLLTTRHLLDEFDEIHGRAASSPPSKTVMVEQFCARRPHARNRMILLGDSEDDLDAAAAAAIAVVLVTGASLAPPTPETSRGRAIAVTDSVMDAVILAGTWAAS